jgi:hypothetical protein
MSSAGTFRPNCVRTSADLRQDFRADALGRGDSGRGSLTQVVRSVSAANKATNRNRSPSHHPQKPAAVSPPATRSPASGRRASRQVPSRQRARRGGSRGGQAVSRESLAMGTICCGATDEHGATSEGGHGAAVPDAGRWGKQGAGRGARKRRRGSDSVGIPPGSAPESAPNVRATDFAKKRIRPHQGTQEGDKGLSGPAGAPKVQATNPNPRHPVKPARHTLPPTHSATCAAAPNQNPPAQKPAPHAAPAHLPPPARRSTSTGAVEGSDQISLR